RIKRLLASESLDALAVREPYVGPGSGDLPPELLHQRRLADARLTSDEDDLELSRARAPHALPQLGESGSATHEAGFHRLRWRRRRRRRRGGCDIREPGDETVAAARDGLDEPGP